jgi:peptide/nickel transport system permease protein
MLGYILRRVGMMIPTLIVISMLSFIIIQLPPGDYLTSYAMALRQSGEEVDEIEIAMLRERYGLGQPVYVQYYKWISGIILRGDWGQSMEWRKPVKDLIWERMALTVFLSLILHYGELVHCHSGGGVFGDAPILDSRLYLLGDQFCRRRHTRGS